MKVYQSRRMPEVGQGIIEESCELVNRPGDDPPDRGEVLESARGVDGILCMLTERIDGAVMDAAGPGLKVISNMAVGCDNVDVAEATRRGIPVGNTPGVLTETTADLAWALLMAGARRISEGVDHVRNGQWKTWYPSLLLGRDVHGATLGIVGMGRIGQAVARRAAGFSMTTVYYDPGPPGDAQVSDAQRLETLEELLEVSDFVSLHAPLTEETRGLIGAAELERMKTSAILVNTARGPLVDQEALAAALCAESISHAALDVTDPEPIAADHPLVTLPNCTIIPHLGSASVATRSRMSEIAARNLLAGLRGEPLPHCYNLRD